VTEEVSVLICCVLITEDRLDTLHFSSFSILAVTSLTFSASVSMHP
jgi:hypothetical protein